MEQSKTPQQTTLYLASLVDAAPSPHPQRVAVCDRFNENLYVIEAISGDGFVVLRVVHEDEPLTLWDGLDSKDDVYEYLRRFSLY